MLGATREGNLDYHNVREVPFGAGMIMAVADPLEADRYIHQCDRHHPWLSAIEAIEMELGGGLALLPAKICKATNHNIVYVTYAYGRNALKEVYFPGGWHIKGDDVSPNVKKYLNEQCAAKDPSDAKCQAGERNGEVEEMLAKFPREKLYAGEKVRKIRGC
eukprot:g8944.t1